MAAGGEIKKLGCNPGYTPASGGSCGNPAASDVACQGQTGGSDYSKAGAGNSAGMAVWQGPGVFDPDSVCSEEARRRAERQFWRAETAHEIAERFLWATTSHSDHRFGTDEETVYLLCKLINDGDLLEETNGFILCALRKEGREKIAAAAEEKGAVEAILEDKMSGLELTWARSLLTTGEMKDDASGAAHAWQGASSLLFDWSSPEKFIFAWAVGGLARISPVAGLSVLGFGVGYTAGQMANEAEIYFSSDPKVTHDRREAAYKRLCGHGGEMAALLATFGALKALSRGALKADELWKLKAIRGASTGEVIYGSKGAAEYPAANPASGSSPAPRSFPVSKPAPMSCSADDSGLMLRTGARAMTVMIEADKVAVNTPKAQVVPDTSPASGRPIGFSFARPDPASCPSGTPVLPVMVPPVQKGGERADLPGVPGAAKMVLAGMDGQVPIGDPIQGLVPYGDPESYPDGQAASERFREILGEDGIKELTEGRSVIRSVKEDDGTDIRLTFVPVKDANGKVTGFEVKAEGAGRLVAAGDVEAVLSVGDVEDIEEIKSGPEGLLNRIEEELDRLWTRCDKLTDKLPDEVLAEYLSELKTLGRRAMFWQSELERLGKLGAVRDRHREDIRIGESLLLDRVLRFAATVFAEPIDETNPAQAGLRSRLKIKPKTRLGLPAPADVNILPALVNRDIGFGSELSLRLHQEEGLHRVQGWLRSQMEKLEPGEPISPEFLQATVVMPVGGGKTRLMVASFAAAIDMGVFHDGDKLILINHTDQIHGQNLKVLNLLGPYFRGKFGRELRISEYKAESRDASGDVVVVSVPSVNNEERRAVFGRELKRALGEAGRVAMVAVDEVHHLELGRGHGKESWTKLLESLRDASPNFFRIGFTA
ncbi:MAG: DEAD/DEAH box helicase family protein, partial [Pseudomonadota bacterium]